MIAVFEYLISHNLLTPGVLAVAMAAVAYQQNKSVREIQGEMKVMAQQQVETAKVLATVSAILERMDETGTRAELRHREGVQGRWESRAGKL